MPRAVIASRSEDAARDPVVDDTVGTIAPVALELSPVPRSSRFPRTARMLAPAEFERCLRRPAFHRSGAFALHLCRTPDAVDATWRLGLVIPKRYEASAVARNTIKRRWRDAFRRGRAAWATEFGGVDLVVRLQSPLMPRAARAGKTVAPGDSPANAASRPTLPARVRGRERFDPVALLALVIERLRRRGGRSALPDAVPDAS